MSGRGNDKLAELVLNGSLSLVAILIAVVGVLIVEYEKVEGIVEVQWHYSVLLWGAASAAVVGGIAALASLARLLGVGVPTWIIIVFFILLIVGTTAGSLGMVLVTLL